MGAAVSHPLELLCHIRQSPGADEGCFGDVYDLVPVYPLRMVSRHVIVRVSCRVVPYDRDVPPGERGVVASADRPVPWPVVRSQVQPVFLYAVFLASHIHERGM